MRRLVTLLLACVLAAPAAGQDVPRKGFPSTFEVATWNVEWFGSTTQGPSDERLQLENVARVIRESHIDLWAVQEIDDPDHFHDLLTELGDGWRGELSTAGSNFKLGFIYREDAVFVFQKGAILTQFSGDFAGRPPLQIEADLMLPTDTLRAVLITLHMKAFGDETSYEQRANAAVRLKNHIDFKLSDRPVVVLGDFNDELSTSITAGQPSPYTDFIADEAGYRFVTRPLDAQDIPTWCAGPTCSSGSTFDHILITDELFDVYEEGSADRYVELLGAVGRYTRTTSDHLPVYARFSFGTHTGAGHPEEEHPQNDAAGRLHIHPNPFSRYAVAAYVARAAGPVLFELYDSTGRRVHRSTDTAAGHSTVNFRVDGTGLAAGVYFAVVTEGDRVTVREIVRAR